eukprot:TRINITY_DN155_c0_g1_i11.p1 TRINITY_DN155_c0_g1~~TRINITY_DN155_c0_g1_i11.p1  ORF type:complete len:1977 (-),score=42.19 TRINITY_DN155_c0_g1_i11:409-6339(-)
MYRLNPAEESISIDWSELTPLSGVPAAVFYPAAFFRDGVLSVLGGTTYDTCWEDVPLDSGAQFNTSTRAWTPISASGSIIRAYATFAEYDNFLYVFGGRKHSGPCFSGTVSTYADMWRMDTASASLTWTSVPFQSTSNPSARFFARSIVWQENWYVFGGADSTWTPFDKSLWRFTFSTRRWTELAPFPDSAMMTTELAVVGRSIITIGGLSYAAGSWVMHKNFWLYSVDQDTWAPLGVKNNSLISEVGVCASTSLIGHHPVAIVNFEANPAVNTEVNSQYALVVGYCGDGRTSTLLGEICDDENFINDDGCTSCAVDSGYFCFGGIDTPSVCQLCGNGVLEGTEICDDANNFNRDGCSAVCTVEPGGSCVVNDTTSMCSTCGDANIGGAESCDDGNFFNGDGCSSTCEIENGFSCSRDPGQPLRSVCQRCGNAKLEGTEECDDGNEVNGDGCSSACTVEFKYTCRKTPQGSSVCFNCGNGIIDGIEECDDGNLDSDDGCSSQCRIEAGFYCVHFPQTNMSSCQNCGDGKRGGIEGCDDGNLAGGDGCSASCTVEAQYICNPDPTNPLRSLCERCGNGKREGSEECDDGNFVDGDGCSAICARDTGYTCINSGSVPSVCYNCGNGILDNSEECDDGGQVANDGCSSTCSVETGFTCTAASPSVCQKCGNSIREGTETCDDGNTVYNDGCSGVCAIESGYSCSTASPNVCQRCGNGIREGTEQCDDQDTASGDGCSATCTIEAGFACTLTSPSVCANCGNGNVEGDEACDDGGSSDGDGCSSKCVIESGFSCTGSNPSVCSNCGNGVREGLEECDDGNTSPADGCSASCRNEGGYSCSTASPNVCQRCGNGAVEGTETCDDGNQAPKDGCSFNCTIEPAFQCRGSPSKCWSCGNGKIDNTAEEQCDDGNTDDGDGCTTLCQKEISWLCDSSEPTICERDLGSQSLTSITPASGLLLGGGTITANGFGLMSSSPQGAVCLFGSVKVEGTPLSTQLLECTVPSLLRLRDGGITVCETPTAVSTGVNATVPTAGMCKIVVKVIIDGIEYPSELPVRFLYYPAARVDRILPSRNVTTFGRTNLTLVGAGFHNLAPAAVSFGDPARGSGQSPIALTTFVSSTLVTVTTPSRPAGVVQLYYSNSFEGGVPYDARDTGVQFEFTSCAAGTYGESFDVPCAPCGLGFARSDLQAKCEPCPRGSYTDTAGSERCTVCPTNTESVPAATHVLNCTCVPTTYHPLGRAGEVCSACKDGGVCVGGDRPPVPMEGFWAARAHDPFVPCDVVEACPGGALNLCETGYIGPRCGLCADRYFERDGLCRRCPENAQVQFAFFVLFGLLVCVVVLIVARKQRGQFINAIAIMASFFQVLSIVLSMELRWPSSVRDTVSWLTVPFTFNIDFLASECSLPIAFTAKWIMTLALPLFFALMFGVIYGVIHLHALVMGRGRASNSPASTPVPSSPRGSLRLATARRSMRDTLMRGATGDTLSSIRNSICNAFVLIVSLLYLVLSEAALSFFDCTKQPDNTWTLDSAPANICFSEWWYARLPVSLAALAVYVVGIPLGVVLLLHRNKTRLYDPVFASRFGVLYQRYHATHAYWEAMVMMRKVALVLGKTLFTQYVTAQATFALAVFVAGLQLQQHAKPMLIARYNTLEQVLLVSSTVVLLSGLMFISAEFSNNTAGVVGVTVVVLACIGGACLVILWYVVWEIREQRRAASVGTAREATQMLAAWFNDADIPIVHRWLLDARTAPMHKKGFYATMDALDKHADLIASTKQQVALDHPATRMITSASGHVLRPTALPLVADYLLHGGNTQGAANCASVLRAISGFKTATNSHSETARTGEGEQNTELRRVYGMLSGESKAEEDDLFAVAAHKDQVDGFFRMLDIGQSWSRELQPREQPSVVIRRDTVGEDECATATERKLERERRETATWTAAEQCRGDRASAPIEIEMVDVVARSCSEDGSPPPVPPPAEEDWDEELLVL